MKRVRGTSKIIYAPNGAGISEGANLKLMKKLLLQWRYLLRYFLAVAAFLKKTFLKILIPSLRSARGACLPEQRQPLKSNEEI